MRNLNVKEKATKTRMRVSLFPNDLNILCNHTPITAVPATSQNAPMDRADSTTNTYIPHLIQDAYPSIKKNQSKFQTNIRLSADPVIIFL